MKYIQFWNWNLGADRTVSLFDSGEMSKYTKFKFFFIVVMLMAAATEMIGWTSRNFDQSYSNIDKVDGLVYIILSILGLIYIYRKHTDESSFIEKFFVVVIASLPVVLIISFIIEIVLYSVYGFYVNGIPETTTWFDVFTTAFVSVVGYWKMGTYFK